MPKNWPGGGNLRVVRHAVNKRQGGARNTAIRMAKGDWLMCIDGDDLFMPGALRPLLDKVRENPALDTLMFDYCQGAEMPAHPVGDYSQKHLDERTMTGVEFLQRMPVPWCPWCYMYRREHLLATGYFFAENVRFEDTDFVLKYTARAKAICFMPHVVVFHWVHPNQTSSNMGSDPVRLRDVFRMDYRTYAAALAERVRSEEASRAIMGQATFMRRSWLKGYAWRMRRRDALAILRECRFTEPTGDGLVDFTNRHVTLTVSLLMLMKPLLSAAVRLKRMLR